MRKNRELSLLLLAALFTISGCEIDHGLEPNEGTVSGTVTYVGSAPPNTESVRVVIFEKYMTREELLELFLSGTLPTFFQSDPLPFDVPQTTYRISIPRGRYEWVAVVWLPQGQTLLQAVEIGAYHRPGDPGERSAIKVEALKELSGIDIVADFNLVASGGTPLALPSVPVEGKTSPDERRWRLR
jgi:hypothetical protein